MYQSSVHDSMTLHRKTEEELGLNGVECYALSSERRIEEAPSGYKPIQPVIDCQQDAG